MVWFHDPLFEPWTTTLGRPGAGRGLDTALFGRPRQARRPFPALDLWGDDERLVLRAAVPGLGPDDVSIEVHRDRLTLSGERPAPELGEGDRELRRERRTGRFERTVRLPWRVDPAQVEASLEHGVLEIRIARPEPDRPSRVRIGTTSKATSKDGDSHEAH